MQKLTAYCSPAIPTIMKEFADQFKSIFVSYESQYGHRSHLLDKVNVFAFRIARADDPYVWKKNHSFTF